MALRRIILKDFVIVEALDLELESGFTVLTGETGAGKSILIDALQQVMGARADAGLVREGSDKADISALFDTTPQLLQLLEEYGIDPDEDQILLRRTIDSQGKSRGWINGIPATASQLRTLGALLIDIHGQHAWQGLMQAGSMRALLDGYGRIATDTIRQHWQDWRTRQQQLESASQGQAQRQQERERLQWQVAEVDKLAPAADEWEQLNAEHQRLAHAQQLLDAVQQALTLLDGDGQGIQHSLQRANHALQEQSHIEPAFQDWITLIAGSQDQLQEVQRGLSNYLDRADLDPQRLEQLDQRLSAWISLARRFRLQPQELPGHWEGWKQQLLNLDAEDDLEALQAAADQAAAAYARQAGQLTQARQQAAIRLGQQISDAMQQLGMEGGRFEVTISPATQPGVSGQDAIDFLVAGHAGSTPRPIAKVASGGELSRIALAIAVTTSQLGSAPTLIFDEVDAGVGGLVAHTVGRLMRQLGSDRQVLAVTHLPQVAAHGHHHLRVSKAVSLHDGRQATVSQTQALDTRQRVQELTRMLGSTSDSAATLLHATEMLQAAHASSSPTP